MVSRFARPWLGARGDLDPSRGPCRWGGGGCATRAPALTAIDLKDRK